MEGLRLNHHRSQIQIWVGRIERTGVGQGPDGETVLGRVNKMRTDKKLGASIGQQRPATRRRVGGENGELKSRRKWQRESHHARESTAATVDQVVFRNGENGGINKPVKVAFRGNVEFVDADVKTLVIDCEVREVGDTRPALVGIVRKRGIEDVNEIVTSWIRSLAGGEI
jgi:hypothetical protein